MANPLPPPTGDAKSPPDNVMVWSKFFHWCYLLWKNVTSTTFGNDSFTYSAAIQATVGQSDMGVFTVFGDPYGVHQLITVQVFTASGTWTRPAGCNAVYVEVIGGGGAGGGAPATGAGQASGGSGGGAGGYSSAWVTTPGATETVTIGAGGTGVSGGNGNAGNASSFGSWATANGGGAGGFNGPSGSLFTGQGGAGATAGTTTGGVALAGSSGGPTLVNFATTAGFGGSGGAGPYGGPPFGPSISTNGNAAAANTGGGGSGALNRDASVGAKTGGNGGSGIIIVRSFT